MITFIVFNFCYVLVLRRPYYVLQNCS